jgi:serine/threonine-protein kinase
MPPEPSPEAVRRQVDQIVSSRCFTHAQRLRTLLQFLVEQTLAGRAGELKESVIGCEVCGRPADFDPKTDSIVRVDANRLRSRLSSYYEGEGASDPVRIALPKGSYVPAFSFTREKRSPPDRASSSYGSIAVLPLVNLSGIAEQEYFSDSLTEQIIHRLSRVRGLRVIARGSVFQFKNRRLDVRVIGQQLGVDWIVEGSVRVVDDRLRITIQMSGAETGALLWSERYERPWHHILDVEEEIAASVTDALRVQFDLQNAAILTHSTHDADAYADYLRGRYLWNQRTPEALEASLQCYEQALQRDPKFSAACAGIADTLMVMALNDQVQTLAAMPRARAAARRAVELSPGSPDALVSLGAAKAIFDWDWDGSERDMQRALQLQPGSAVGHYLYAVLVLQPQARWTEALQEMETAARLDPVSPVLLRDLGMLHFMRRDWESAEKTWSKLEQAAPDYRGALFWRARLAIEQQRFEHALSLLDSRVAAGRANSRVAATAAYAKARSGHTREAEQTLEDLARQSQETWIPPLNLAIICLGLERWEDALGWLNKACEERAAPLYQFAVDPAYDPVRADVRAQAVRLSIGLPEFVTR